MSPARRLYYSDSFVRVFDATVIGCAPAGDRFEVLLDQTAFYPASGGQPFDVGRLGDVDIIDVVDRDDDIVHLVTGQLVPGQRLTGEIEWARRFDHMQQHTGQHVLSAAFDRVHGAVTDSFHLGAEVCTIDLNHELTPDQIAAAEAEANRIVWDDRPVRVHNVSEEDARLLPLRKAPARTGALRVIEVSDFDFSACGGTHVARTGMIGIIAITAWERFKGGTRVSFVCGRRALDAHRRLRDIVMTMGRTLSVIPGELNVNVERLQGQARELRRQTEGLEKTLSEYRAAEIRDQAETIGCRRVVLRAESTTDAAALRLLAQLIVRSPGLVAMLAGGGVPAPLVIARSGDVELDAGAVLEDVIAALGGRGGGKADLAQGGIGAAASEVVTFLRQRLESVKTW